MSIFGRWFRQNGHDALSPIDMEATRAAVQRESFPRLLDEAAAKVRAQEARDTERREALLQERKEQSIIAALVFGCSCGSAYHQPPEPLVVAWEAQNFVPSWLRTHTHCAGLGAMAREDA